MLFELAPYAACFMQFSIMHTPPDTLIMPMSLLAKHYLPVFFADGRLYFALMVHPSYLHVFLLLNIISGDACCAQYIPFCPG